MKKYIKLYLTFLRINAIKRLTYRANFILGAVLVSFESITVILGIKIIFNHVGNIAGWNFDDMLVLSGIFMITHALAWLFYKGGLNDLDKIINKGDLDWHLIRPVDPQFIISTHRIDLEDAARSLVGIFIMIYGLRNSELFTTLSYIPFFFITLVAGAIVLYSFTLVVKTISFKSIQGWSTNSIFWRFHNLAQFPTDIYTGLVKTLYTFIFPLIFIATVPAKALTGKLTLQLLIGSILAAIISFTISRLIWKYALRSYSSASS